MSLEAAINSIIRGDDAVADIVGTNVRPAIVQQYDPSDASTHPPFVVYQISKAETFDTLDAGPADYRPAEVQIECYQRTYDAAATLADAVATLLAGYGGTVQGIEIDTDFRSETDIEEGFLEGDDAPVFMRQQTFGILYRRTINNE